MKSFKVAEFNAPLAEIDELVRFLMKSGAFSNVEAVDYKMVKSRIAPILGVPLQLTAAETVRGHT